MYFIYDSFFGVINNVCIYNNVNSINSYRLYVISTLQGGVKNGFNKRTAKRT